MEAPYRNLTAELHRGQTDGKYKKICPDRGGVLDPINAIERQALPPIYYNTAQAAQMIAPDGRTVSPDGAVIAVPVSTRYGGSVVHLSSNGI